MTTQKGHGTAEGIANKNINETKTLLLSTYKRYKEKPTETMLKTLFRLCFELGYEAGRLSIFNSRKL